MSNNHNSPSTSPEGEYRLKLNNWLQSRGWRDQLTWDEPVKNGPDHQPIWSAICKCPSHLSPRLLDFLPIAHSQWQRIWYRRGEETRRRGREGCSYGLSVPSLEGGGTPYQTPAERTCSLIAGLTPIFPGLFRPPFSRCFMTHSLFPFVVHRCDASTPAFATVLVAIFIVSVTV